MKRVLSVLALLCPFLGACQLIVIHGKVMDEEGGPVAGATIVLKGTPRTVVSDHRGLFTLTDAVPTDTLVVSATGYREREVPMGVRGSVTVVLHRQATSLPEVTVSTGYQVLPRERATGSFDVIGEAVVQRRPGLSLLDRIESTVPALHRNRADNAQPNALSIRGRSTLLANAEPLIILDNFPYDGELANINPADIESVTVLKDAAAASIWGARAGNGVIVLTTKKGRTAKPQVTASAALTLTGKPDLFSVSTISAADYIELEKFLYGKGFYAGQLSHPGRPPLTPVVELLEAVRTGALPPAEAEARIEALKGYDARHDIGRYLLRQAALQQYAMSVGGATPVHRYHFSAGFDRSLSDEVGAGSSRLSLRTTNAFTLHPRLDLQAGLALVQRGTKAGANPGYGLGSGGGRGVYPYARLVDDAGQPAVLVRDYRASFAAAAPAAGLLPWTYNPIEDIPHTDNRSRLRDYLVNGGLIWRAATWLTAEMRYQYEASVGSTITVYGEESYYARNLVNQFTQVSAAGVLSRPLPPGGIRTGSDRELQSHQGRAQLTLRKTWGAHSLSALAGGEVKDLRTTSHSHTLYGYNDEAGAVVTNIDYSTRWKRYDNPNLSATIPHNASLAGATDRFRSLFANAGYSYKGRYHLSGSARKDASNLFGVRTNQKGVPLWSAGVRWDVHGERFYRIAFLERLSLRGTWGYSGNIARNTSAFTTASYGLSPATGLVTASINNPPNAGLRWEQNRTINAGLDFALKGGRLRGSVEGYWKKATDLMGRAPIDATVGLAGNAGGSTFFGNIAAMRGRGWDLQLEGTPFKGAVTWTTTVLLSRSINEVTRYDMPVSALGNAYLGESFLTPVVGRPLFSVFAFRSPGLNGAGDPVGYVNGQAVTDYAGLVNKTPLDSLLFRGSITPGLFGAWRNTVGWGALSLSWVVSYKGDYWYRRPSVNYSLMFSNWTGHGDYAGRWQKAGDEALTGVPSLQYPANSNRDRFYNYSEGLTGRADHLRLEEVGITLALERTRVRWLPVSGGRLTLMATDLGTLWVANRWGQDPYYVSSPQPGRSFSLALHLNL